jgi:hypothetical protein
MARDRSSELTARLLRLPEIDMLGLLRGASNYTFLVRLCGPDQDEMLAVYKPGQGESPLWDFAAGTLYRREVAAYELSKALGWPHIPPTVVREEAPYGPGALQQFIEADRKRHYLTESATDSLAWRQIALFDVVTNNADRKSGHCLFDSDGVVWVIDHGLTFHTQPKLRTVIWDFAGEPLPRQLRTDVKRSVDGLAGQLGARLQGLIARAELRALQRRLEAVLEPQWRFPRPGSSWSVPWPPV